MFSFWQPRLTLLGRQPPAAPARSAWRRSSTNTTSWCRLRRAVSLSVDYLWSFSPVREGPSRAGTPGPRRVRAGQPGRRESVRRRWRNWWRPRGRRRCRPLPGPVWWGTNGELPWGRRRGSPPSAAPCRGSGGWKDEAVTCAIMSVDDQLQYHACFCSYRYRRLLPLSARPLLLLFCL